MAKLPKGIEITGKVPREAARLLTPEAMNFLAGLHRAFNAARHMQGAKDALPDFKPGTSAVRDGAWKAAPVPPDLRDLRTVLMAPTDRKTMIAALNSGARACVADFAGMNVPAWDNMIEGHINLMDRWTSAMEHTDQASGKRTALAQKLAALLVRPRGLQQDERHVRIDGKPVAAGLFDAGLYLFHNARTAVAKASGPYLLLPGMANQAQARLWNDIIIRMQSDLGLPLGCIRVAVMLETLHPVFEMDEIIFELRDHVMALSFDLRGYAFSLIAASAARRTAPLPDREALLPLHEAVAGLLIATAHRRGCLALSGPAASLQSRAEAEHAVRIGHDGVLVAHAEAVAPAARVFNDDMPTPNQVYVSRDDLRVTREALLAIPDGVKSEAAFRGNMRVAVLSIEAWLRGRGSVVIDAGAEDARSTDLRWAQTWQWLRHGVKLDTGRKVTDALFEVCLAEEMKRVKADLGDEAYRNGRFKEAAALFKSLCLAIELAPGFTAAAARKLA